MNVGYANRDITPEHGITLSGFASRCNRPSKGVDDPLSVHAMVLQQDGRQVLLIVFDLLGLGPELTDEIHAALDQCVVVKVPREFRIFCCTHTHSAPATITLIGCGIPDRAYWSFLVKQAAEAAAEASNNLRSATLKITSVNLTGANYNRRHRLSDGRVVMKAPKGLTAIKNGPVIDEMLLLFFEDENGKPIVGISQWAAHPCTVSGMYFSADFPGELRRRLAEKFSMPFFFLTGACGNINPPFSQMTRQEMLRNVDGIMDTLERTELRQEHISASPFAYKAQKVALPYALQVEKDVISKFFEGMREIANSGDGPPETLAVLSNILNVEPGQQADQVMLKYFAETMKTWSEDVLAGTSQVKDCDVFLAVLRIGKLAVCFIAAEVFAETAIYLQAANPELTLITVGYASPMIGYLPTDEAMTEGGYEVDYAYRFYGHPAPFAPGAEEKIRLSIQAMIKEI